MTEQLRQKIQRAKDGMDCYFGILLAVHQRQRAALHIVHQCAEKAEEVGDLEEAERLYHYLHTEFQSLFHEPSWALAMGPDYTKPPIDVSRWLTPDMFAIANLATGARGPSFASKTLLMALPARRGVSLLGDLDEEFVAVILPRFGLAYARKWYWKQVIWSLIDYFAIALLRSGTQSVKEIVTEIISRLLGLPK